LLLTAYITKKKTQGPAYQLHSHIERKKLATARRADVVLDRIFQGRRNRTRIPMLPPRDRVEKFLILTVRARISGADLLGIPAD
jgi:hypothetical protein